MTLQCTNDEKEKVDKNSNDKKTTVVIIINYKFQRQLVFKIIVTTNKVNIQHYSSNNYKNRNLNYTFFYYAVILDPFPQGNRLHDVALLLFKSTLTYIHFANIVDIVKDLLFVQERGNKIGRSDGKDAPKKLYS